MGETHHAKYARILAAIASIGIDDEMRNKVLHATGMDARDLKEAFESAKEAARDVERRL